MILKYKLILASNSLRRKELLKGLDIDFTAFVLPNIDESYPSDLKQESVAEYLANKKAKAYKEILHANNLLITADTVVIFRDQIFGKPKDAIQAKSMLSQLSNNEHKVITGVSLSTLDKHISFSAESRVKFKYLADQEIDYYIEKYRPFDKAGAYGIQEWIGYIGVEKIEGSYFNIMGLPVYELNQELKKF